MAPPGGQGLFFFLQPIAALTCDGGREGLSPGVRGHSFLVTKEICSLWKPSISLSQDVRVTAVTSAASSHFQETRTSTKVFPPFSFTSLFYFLVKAAKAAPPRAERCDCEKWPRNFIATRMNNTEH